MLKFKDGVIVGSPVQELIQAIHIVATVYTEYDPYGYDCWITSMADGDHKGKPVDASGKDPHFVGKACDFRIQNVPQKERALLVERIIKELGTNYYVEWEAQGAPNEHLHVQIGKAI